MELITTENGYLININEWNAKVASSIAEQNKLKLNTDRWKVINYIRDFYLKYQAFPTMRIIIKHLRTQEIAADSIYLYQLFPDNPIKLASKIAGLPEPKNCI